MGVCNGASGAEDFTLLQSYWSTVLDWGRCVGMRRQKKSVVKVIIVDPKFLFSLDTSPQFDRKVRSSGCTHWCMCMSAFLFKAERLFDFLCGKKKIQLEEFSKALWALGFSAFVGF